MRWIALAAAAAALAGCGEVEPLEGRARDGGIPLGTAVTLAPLRDDDQYRRILARTFTSVTPENEQKWEVVHPARASARLGPAAAAVGHRGPAA
jgi:GH35 family endo-1,4-beta-xylanase